MFSADIAAVVLILLLVLVFSGIHVAIALGVTSAVGIYMVTGRETVVLALIQNTFYDAIRDYVFAVIPLFAAYILNQSLLISLEKAISFLPPYSNAEFSPSKDSGILN